MSVRQNLLFALEEHRGEDISGQELANRLCVSRAAVWKAIKSLQAEGYGIDASPGRGYRRGRTATAYRREESASICPRNTPSCAVEAVQEIDSTNRAAKRQALGAGTGTLPTGRQLSNRREGTAAKELLFPG